MYVQIDDIFYLSDDSAAIYLCPRGNVGELGCLDGQRRLPAQWTLLPSSTELR